MLGGVSPTGSARALAVLLATAGVTHFAVPRPFDAIVPRALPGGPRLWTYLSGAAELAVAAAVVAPRTRRVGGLAAAGLFAAVFPANVQMARDWRRRMMNSKPLEVIRSAQGLWRSELPKRQKKMERRWC